MKHLFNNLSQEEKQRILEMHNTNKNSLNEQGILSGIKQGVKGFGAQVSTGLSNVKGSFSGSKGQANAKSAGLENDLAQVKSRSGDLLNTITPLTKEIQGKLQNLSKPDVYGKGFTKVQDDFKTQLTTLNTALNVVTEALNSFNQYIPKYTQEAPAQQAPAQPAPAQDTSNQNPKPKVSGNQLSQTTGTPLQQ
jgi:hypothetical protein